MILAVHTNIKSINGKQAQLYLRQTSKSTMMEKQFHCVYSLCSPYKPTNIITHLSVQSFSDGAKGTDFMKAGPVASCLFGADVVPFLSFPSFNVFNESAQYASAKLGYLTWTETMSPAKWGKAPVDSTHLDGLSGGPVVLFDDSGNNAIVVSTNDNFAVSTQINKMYSPSTPLTYMFHLYE